MLDQTLAPWLEHDSEFPELLVLESKLEWIFKEAVDSVSDSESHLRFVHCQHSPQMTKEYSSFTHLLIRFHRFCPLVTMGGSRCLVSRSPIGIGGFPRRLRATGLRKGRHNFFLFCINVLRDDLKIHGFCINYRCQKLIKAKHLPEIWHGIMKRSGAIGASP